MKKRKINIQKNEIFTTIALSLIPLLSCIVYCIFRGESLQHIFLPNTTCSDDIFYYKMVEGIVNFGHPLGYFGYNESHAMVSSFGVWSPVLLLPWALWGILFGWGFSSPIICNICMLSIGFAIFAASAKPTWQQAISIALLFIPVTPFTRYMLSGMPETFCYTLVIITYGIVYSYFKNNNAYKLILIFLLITILSLMRPYFMVLLLLPGILWVRKSKLSGILGTVFLIFLNLLGYILMTHFFAAPYFYSSMATDFIDSFKHDGFFAGCFFLFNKLCSKWNIIRWNMSVGVQEGFTDGQIYLACCVAMLFLLIWLLFDFIKLKQQYKIKQNGNENTNTTQNIVLESSQFIFFAVMLLAIIVLYQIPEGSRHILAFLVGFIILGAMREHSSLKNSFLITAVFAYLFIVKYDNIAGYQVPYSGQSIITEVENLSNIFDSHISLNHTNVPSYDNVIAWVVGDSVNGEIKEIPWRVLFALPDGAGISCCLPQYMTANIDNLNSRYIITITHGQIDLLLQSKEIEELVRDKNFVLYKRY